MRIVLRRLQKAFAISKNVLTLSSLFNKSRLSVTKETCLFASFLMSSSDMFLNSSITTLLAKGTNPNFPKISHLECVSSTLFTKEFNDMFSDSASFLSLARISLSNRKLPTSVFTKWVWKFFHKCITNAYNDYLGIPKIFKHKITLRNLS